MLLRCPGEGSPLLFGDQLCIEKDLSLVEAHCPKEGNPGVRFNHLAELGVMSHAILPCPGLPLEPGLPGHKAAPVIAEERGVISRLSSVHLGRRTWPHPGVHSGEGVH